MKRFFHRTVLMTCAVVDMYAVFNPETLRHWPGVLATIILFIVTPIFVSVSVGEEKDETNPK